MEGPGDLSKLTVRVSRVPVASDFHFLPQDRAARCGVLCGAVLDARHGASMITSTSHEGGQHFLRRARHFAARESAALPVSVTMLAAYLLYLGGATAEQIAAWEEERREAELPAMLKSPDLSAEEVAAWATVTRCDVAKQLMTCMALLGAGELRARVMALSEEMGVINFDARGGEVLRFPGPPKLAPHRTVEVAL
jgi:hypothetical protein